MPEMILPGTYIEVRPEGLITPGRVTVGNLGIVGTASKGPIGKPTILGSYTEAREVFGNYDAFVGGNSDELTLLRALEQAYNHGASTVFVVRLTSTEAVASGDSDNFVEAWSKNTKARKATFAVDGETADTVSANLKARTHGTWGNSISINVFDATDDSYIVDEKHDGPEPVTLVRKPIAENTRNRIRIFLGATGQTKIFNPIYSPAVPSPGDVHINTTTGVLTFAAEEAPIVGDELYASYTVPKANSRQVTIRYAGVSEDYTVADGAHLVKLLNDIDSPSLLVKGVDAPDATEIPKKNKKNTSGDDFVEFGRGTNIPGSNGPDAKDADYKLGLDQLLNEAVHIVVAAGMDNTKIGDELKSHVEVASTDKIKKDRIAVVGSKVKATFDDIRGHNLNSERIIFVAPGIKSTDAASGKEVTLPGSYTAAAIAGMLSSRDPHISLTNKAPSVPGLQTKFTSPQLEQIVQAQVLVLEERRGFGFRIVKAITTSDNTAWHQITTRRIVDYAKYGVRSASNPYIGRLNNERVRGALKSTINSFLTEMVDDEMLISYELDVSATRDQEIKGIVQVTIALRPTFSIDFIKVTMFLE